MIMRAGVGLHRGIYATLAFVLLMPTPGLTLPLCPTCPADANGSASVNAEDIQAFVNCLNGGSGADCGCADMNADGVVDAADVALLVSALISPPLGGAWPTYAGGP